MELADLARLFEEARRLTGHTEFVVIGSLSALGVVDSRQIPSRMLLSIDVDCFTRQDPGRIFDLNSALGQGSPFEAAYGYYLDPVSPDLPTLPEGWEHRLVRLALGESLTVFFLDPNDAAISKYARADPRDREWLRAGFEAGLLSPAIIESRMRQTTFIDDEEQVRAMSAFAEDRSASTAKTPRRKR